MQNLELDGTPLFSNCHLGCKFCNYLIAPNPDYLVHGQRASLLLLFFLLGDVSKPKTMVWRSQVANTVWILHLNETCTLCI
jgi:hypothetical protein